MAYTIDWGTGVTNEDEQGIDTIEEAMQIADKRACYTQQDIEIVDDEGYVMAERRWIGVEYRPDDVESCENPILFGGCGYYTDWDMAEWLAHALRR